jgi:hypothetical protein
MSNDKNHSTSIGRRDTLVFEHAVAGLGAGATATLLLHPLDLIKVRFQG